MPTPDNSLRRRVQTLEKEISELKRLQRAPRPARLVRDRDRMVAITQAMPNEEYPEEGDTLPIAFLDAHFVGTPHTGAPLYTARSSQGRVWAKSLGRQYIAANTIVLVERIRGLGAAGSGEWWISTAIGRDRSCTASDPLGTQVDANFVNATLPLTSLAQTFATGYQNTFSLDSNTLYVHEDGSYVLAWRVELLVYHDTTADCVAFLIAGPTGSDFGSGKLSRQVLTVPPTGSSSGWPVTLSGVERIHVTANTQLGHPAGYGLRATVQRSVGTVTQAYAAGGEITLVRASALNWVR
jgi:hypothetical protein